MPQYDFGTIDPYTADGVQLAAMLNNWRDAVHSWHRGPSRPLYVVPGMMWVNDSGGPTGWVINLYMGPSIGDRPVGTYDTTTGAITTQAASSRWDNRANGADLKTWRATVVSPDGRLRFSALSDAGVVQASLDLLRSGVMLGTSPAPAAAAGEIATASWVRALLTGGGGGSGAPLVTPLLAGSGAAYPVPDGTSWLRATIKGSGGATGINGNPSIFNGIVAAGGGAAGGAIGGAGGTGGAGAAAYRTPGQPGGMGGLNVGGTGGGGGAGRGGWATPGSGNVAGSSALANSGAGGGGAAGEGGIGNGGGGEGETAVVIITGSLAPSYVYTVGPGVSDGTTGSGSGRIIVEAFP
jgi:hypothetical protein